jgi:hypothetical protein
MAGVTDTQSIRFGQVSDVVTHTMLANEADDIATQLDAADAARTVALHRPQAQAARNAAQSIPNVTVTVITWDSEVIDTSAMIDLVGQPQRVTVGATAGVGVYHVSIDCSVDTTGWARGDVILNKNGTEIVRKTSYQPQTNGSLGLEALVNMTATTDYFTVALFHDGGASTSTFDIEIRVQKISN